VDLAQVDLNRLVAFDTLMAEQNVTAAARRLCVGQSAMSSTLARLRALTNDPILERQGRRMVPTPLATSLIGPVRDALAQFNVVLMGPPTFDPERDRRTFTVMVSEYAALAVMQPLLVQLRHAAPHVELRIRSVSADFLDELTSDTVDLVVVPPGAAPVTDHFDQQRLYSDPYVVAVDQANPLVGDTMTLEQFSSLPYLASISGHGETLVEHQLDRLGVSRRLEVTTGFGLAPFLLRDTRLVALLPSSLASTVAAGARLKLLEPPMQLEPLIETMVWSTRNSEDPGHSWLRRRLSDVAARRTWSTTPVDH